MKESTTNHSNQRPHRRFVKRPRRTEVPVTDPGQLSPASGFLEVETRGNGFLRQFSPRLDRGADDVQVPAHLIARHKLRPGVILGADCSGAGGRNAQAVTVTSVNGMPPDRWESVQDFNAHEVVSPTEWIRLEGPGNAPATRIIDLFCPIGRGQRALIVSPPKAGKTMLLQHIAHAVSRNYKDIALVVLLVDERPEEVTEIRRSITGEVFASSSDTDRGDQVRLATLTLEYAKRKVEGGQDVVLLLDSLTRLGRAFNLHQRGSGRTLSGGVDARALEVPKRIFGAARKLEGHGSLTIIATALIETNSRMDELIFQEFKGTGNMELVLDRSLADERIFPALNLGLSGTRREELLFGSEAFAHQALRRAIARKTTREAALAVQKLLQQYPTNELLLQKVDVL